MTAQEYFLRTMIFLMQEEIYALRSVLSEFEGDKKEHTQMIRADDYRTVIEGLQHKLFI